MSALQRSWDARAAANFMLGGAGAGLVACAPLTGNSYATLAGLAMIAVGLGAVWLETGRKLRAAHVLFNPFTSWMTREAFAALLLFPLGLFFPLLAAPVALVFLYCQARILRAAKGIPAWRTPWVVPLIVLSGLAEGGALLLLMQGNVIGIPVLAAGGWIKFSLVTRRAHKQAPRLPRLPVRGAR
jgi:phenylacetyl-CoA:acceptor oxidoreductase subunit 2